MLHALSTHPQIARTESSGGTRWSNVTYPKMPLCCSPPQRMNQPIHCASGRCKIKSNQPRVVSAFTRRKTQNSRESFGFAQGLLR